MPLIAGYAMPDWNRTGGPGEYPVRPMRVTGGIRFNRKSAEG